MPWLVFPTFQAVGTWLAFVISIVLYAKSEKPLYCVYIGWEMFFGG